MSTRNPRHNLSIDIELKHLCSPTWAHPASWQQYINNIVRVGIIKESFVTHDTRMYILFAGKTILNYFCTNACFYFRSTHL